MATFPLAPPPLLGAFPSGAVGLGPGSAPLALRLGRRLHSQLAAGLGPGSTPPTSQLVAGLGPGSTPPTLRLDRRIRPQLARIYAASCPAARPPSPPAARPHQRRLRRIWRLSRRRRRFLLAPSCALRRGRRTRRRLSIHPRRSNRAGFFCRCVAKADTK